MPIPRECRDDVFYELLSDTQLSEKEVKRFVNNATRINKRCPFCNGYNVYVGNIQGATFIDLLLILGTFGLYLFVLAFTLGARGRVYFCLDHYCRWH